MSTHPAWWPRPSGIPDREFPGIPGNCGSLNSRSGFPGNFKASGVQKNFVKILTKYDKICLICLCDLYHKSLQIALLICMQYRNSAGQAHVHNLPYTVQWFAHHIVSPHDTDIAILCVCPSHSGNFWYCIETAKHIVTIFQHEVAQSFYQTFLSSNIKHLTGSFFAEANILVGYKKFRNFRPLTRYILQMIQGSSIIVVENQ